MNATGSQTSRRRGPLSRRSAWDPVEPDHAATPASTVPPSAPPPVEVEQVTEQTPYGVRRTCRDRATGEMIELSYLSDAAAHPAPTWRPAWARVALAIAAAAVLVLLLLLYRPA